MTPEDPRHGSYAGTIAHWKAGETPCEPCALAGTRMRKKNELARLAGRPNMVELGAEAWAVLRLTPRNQLAVATGMTHERLHRYDKAGPRQRVHRRTRDRILGAAVPAWTPVGVQRRLQALAALGWSLAALAERSGMHATSLGKLRCRPVVKHVRLGFAARVVALYDELHMQVPPAGASSTEARNEALRKGWVPPLGWDNIDIDPTPVDASLAGRVHDDVDDLVVERLLAGVRVRSTRAEKVEALRRWVEMGRSRRSLETLHGWKYGRYWITEAGQEAA